MLTRRDMMLSTLAGSTALAAGFSPALAQAIDTLQIFVPAAPGGGWDQTGRTIEAVLKANKQIGNAQVTNVPGAGGAVGLPQFVNQWKGRQNSVMVAGIEAMKAQGVDDEFTSMDPDDLPFACDDSLVTTAIDATAFLPQKMQALRAHGTQVSVDGGFFALADNVGAEAFGVEYFRLANGAPQDSRETDLFAGIDA